MSAQDMSQQTNFRGIEHIGITVPDHAEAVAFFVEAFGAEVLYSLTDKSRPPLSGDAIGSKNGLLKSTAIVAVSMLRFGNGPNVELFEIDRPRSTQNASISDIGISHFSITVEDIDAASESFAAAGGTLLEGPYPLTDQEEGPGNRGRFGLAPWGLLIELEQLPAPMTYDEGASTTRWLPAPR
ncbi:VOC family protein [Methyloligella sp. 2.7D]|uniref:VOC family protein n=1 Tax=unclassified Methyloligella TaxID=2625955 RepID=UPI00157D801C|nr:VOC family protein [Methyloligella sp. GL2]QKP77636.1 VOC family protein [Methyloligella sp. GL2]